MAVMMSMMTLTFMGRAGTRQPVLAQFDEESKRFMVFCPQIGKSIQVPVTKWFAIPDPNK